jgi:hypothetical protein
MLLAKRQRQIGSYETRAAGNQDTHAAEVSQPSHDAKAEMQGRTGRTGRTGRRGPRNLKNMCDSGGRPDTIRPVCGSARDESSS